MTWQYREHTDHHELWRTSKLLTIVVTLVQRVAKIDRTFFYAAWGAGEFAIETKMLKHGAFTSALLAGPSGAADTNSDKAVNLGELISYTTAETQRLTADAQNPYVASTGGFDELLFPFRS